MIRKAISYPLLLTVLASLITLSFYIELTYGQRQKLFAPNAYLQYGPAPGEAIIMWLRTAEFLNTESNQTINVYDPNTVMSNYTNAVALFPGDTIQPTFDSYFVFNRLVQQVVPNISNVSINIARVLNPFDVRHITQVKLDPAITLRHLDKDNKSYVIPQGLKTGLYLANLSIYFPDYKIRAIYSNGVYINSSMTSPFAMSNSSRPSSFGPKL